MRILLPLLATIALAGLPVLASAHTGGTLDADGCHEDHRTGTFHCHRGAAAGYSFPNRAAMEEAVRTGNFPEKSVATESFLSKLWPFGRKSDVGEPDPAGTAVPVAAGGATAQQTETEQRLKVLQGLYEMGLISKEEFEAKRKAILDGI